MLRYSSNFFVPI